MANYTGNGGRPAKPLDWDVVLFWMEYGTPVQEVASRVGLTPSHLGRRARAELKPEWVEKYKKLAQVNRSKDIPCGTNGGYAKHLRLGEPVDEACREAHRLATEDWRLRRGKAGTQADREARDQGTGGNDRGQGSQERRAG